MFNFFSASAVPHREHSSQSWQLRCDVTGNHGNWGMTNSITHTHTHTHQTHYRIQTGP